MDRTITVPVVTELPEHGHVGDLVWVDSPDELTHGLCVLGPGGWAEAQPHQPD